jgi:hypothetical protein
MSAARDKADAPGPAMNGAAQSEREILKRLESTPELFDAIESESGPELQVQSRLRERFSPELVRMALEVAEMRRRGHEKFSRADRMWLSRKGLEQSTPEPVARHKAQRFAHAATPVWDLCCGVGGDAIALASQSDVTAVDLDPANCLRTELNAKVYDVLDRVTTLCSDAIQLDLSGRLVHIDPDRRAGGKRVLRLEQYQPGLEFLQTLAQHGPGGAIKVSPASNFGGKFPGAEIELVSLQGECKEATVWFGELRGEHPWRATVLPAGETLSGHPLDAYTNVSSPGKYLFDPDPAVVRAGLVDLCAERLGLWRLDDADEYLSGSAPVDSPFVTPFEICELLPNNPTAIRKAIRSAGLGSVEIKCRHVPVDADAVRRKLPLEGSGSGVLVFARIAGKARALLCRRLQPPAENC